VGDSGVVVGPQRLEEDECKAAEERHTHAVQAGRSDVWLQPRDGLVVLLDSEDLETVAGEVGGQGFVGVPEELVSGAEGHHGVADGRVVRVLIRMIADGLRGDAVPEIGEDAEFAVDGDGAVAVEEAAADLATVDVRCQRPHIPQRLVPLTCLEELGFGQLGALEGVQDNADPGRRPVLVIAITSAPGRGATETGRLLLATLDTSDSTWSLA